MPRAEPGMRPPPGESAGQNSRGVMAKHKAAGGGHSVSKSEDWSPAAGAGKAKRVDWGAYSERAGKGTLPPESAPRGAPGHNPFEGDRRTSSAENDDPTVLQTDWFKLLTPQEQEAAMLRVAEKTTADARRVLKIAEDTRDIGANTLVTLHEQGEQIRRTHQTAVQVDQELSKGEKMLGKLGPIFSRTWKPKKGRAIAGPLDAPELAVQGGPRDKQQRAALMQQGKGKGRDTAALSDSEAEIRRPKSVVELEHEKQDEIFDGVSKALDDMKKMSIDMGRELGRQEQGVDHLTTDVTTLNKRLEGTHKRAVNLMHKGIFY
ncbi:SNAP25 homologous protein [Klebsormidium nitens]|uniref:SNAP25 homologous protein n=1 Tax=Klebsormidium nitens TaxID=105231 RepID=A0A1Y1IMS7_KLENI|nr:SNAP25 homologous protein [Klebsormidium nitens]|eukprot:GAQ90451.1 SNAP25 homologous protein [Klebsormidium nitens]